MCAYLADWKAFFFCVIYNLQVSTVPLWGRFVLRRCHNKSADQTAKSSFSRFHHCAHCIAILIIVIAIHSPHSSHSVIAMRSHLIEFLHCLLMCFNFGSLTPDCWMGVCWLLSTAYLSNHFLLVCIILVTLCDALWHFATHCDATQWQSEKGFNELSTNHAMKWHKQFTCNDSMQWTFRELSGSLLVRREGLPALACHVHNFILHHVL